MSDTPAPPDSRSTGVLPARRGSTASDSAVPYSRPLTLLPDCVPLMYVLFIDIVISGLSGMAIWLYLISLALGTPLNREPCTFALGAFLASSAHYYVARHCRRSCGGVNPLVTNPTATTPHPSTQDVPSRKEA